MTNDGSPETRCRSPRAGIVNSFVTRSSAVWRRLPSSRIALARQRRELRARHPGVLDELELTRDVRVQTDEVQPSIRVVRGRWLECFVDRQRRTELAAAAKNAMETDGRDHVILKRTRRQAQIGEALLQSGLVMRVVAVPGIRPADVGAEWAADTGRVVVKRELNSAAVPAPCRLRGESRLSRAARAARPVASDQRAATPASLQPDDPHRRGW